MSDQEIVAECSARAKMQRVGFLSVSEKEFEALYRVAGWHPPMVYPRHDGLILDGLVVPFNPDWRVE